MEAETVVYLSILAAAASVTTLSELEKYRGGLLRNVRIPVREWLDVMTNKPKMGRTICTTQNSPSPQNS
ncbi:hypothetical protein M1403_03120 [Patescibacteria group bacterium]|nr:hypothetical protein [Patescibacteria group bacterium]